jgi:sulfate permease, SulP family
MSTTSPSPRGLARRLPILGWLPKYERRWLPLDAIAGITVWALMVPEAMAYAGIAGVPVQYGLYAIPLALLGYAIFGSSRELFVGPSASVVALSAAAVGAVAVAKADPNAYIALTATLAVIVGLLYLLGGLTRLGWIEHLFARPVLDGFIIGLGLFVAVGQVPKLVGIEKPSGDTIAIFVRTLTDIGEWNWTAVAVGVGALALLFGLKRWAPRVPAAIVAVVVSILCVNLFNLDDHGVKLVGKVPTGFNFVSYSTLSWHDVWAVVPGAVAIVIVGFAESIAIAKTYAAEHKYTVDANQEMLAYGAANLGAGVLQGFAVCGSLSKSAASQGARARTQVASLVTSIVVLLTILFLAGLFQDLPEPVLGAIVIEAVVGMLGFNKLTALGRARSAEFWAALGALLGVIVIDVFPGVVIGVALSFGLLIHALDHPRISRLGRSEDGARYADVATHPDVTPVPDIVIERFEGPLLFTNAELLVSQVRQHVDAATPPPRAVVLDFEGVTQVDITGNDALRRMHDTLQPRGVRLALARVDASVHDALDREGTLTLMGVENEFTTVRAAVAHLSSERAPVPRQTDPSAIPGDHDHGTHTERDYEP